MSQGSGKASIDASKAGSKWGLTSEVEIVGTDPGDTDGSLLDERGVTPQIPFAAPPEGFQGTRDDLLEAALDRLKDVVLPERPIDGPTLSVAGQWPGYRRGSPTGMALALDGNYVLVAADALQVIDIRDPAHPQRVGVCASSECAIDVAVSGHHVFVADRARGLRVIDFEDPKNPKLVASFQTSAWAQGITLFDSYAYVLLGSSGAEIVDITDPLRPIRMGLFGTNMSRMRISGSYAYVGGGNWGTLAFDIFDLKDPLHPQWVSSSPVTGNARVYDLAVSGNYAYVAAGIGGLLVFDVTDPAHPVQVGVCTEPSSANFKAVAVLDRHVVVADKRDLMVIDVADPIHPRFLGESDAGAGSVAVIMSGTTACTLNRNAGLELFSVADPAKPQRLGYLQVSAMPRKVAIAGDYACIAEWQGGMEVISIVDPEHPQRAATFDLEGRVDVRSVATVGNIACMLDVFKGLYVIDLAAADGPRQVGAIPIGSGVDVVASEAQAYVMDVFGKLQVIDLTNPASPRKRGACKLPDGTRGLLAVESNYVYAAISGFGLSAIDVSTPDSPRVVGSCLTNWSVNGGMAVVDGCVYVAADPGIHILDARDPKNPQCKGLYVHEDSGFTLPLESLTVAGPIAYAVAWGNVDTVDITDPYNPKMVSSLRIDQYNGVAASGNRICVTDSGSGLKILVRRPGASWFAIPPRLDIAGCRFSFQGVAGMPVSLQRSTDLAHWEEWKTIVTSGKAQEVTDPQAISHPAQFYRAVAQ